MFAIVAFTTVAAGYRWQQEVTLTFHAQQFCSLAAAAAAFAVLVLRVSGLQVCGVFLRNVGRVVAGRGVLGSP